MRLLHVGIVVSHYGGGMDGAIERYRVLGYEPVFRVRRSEPWIGEIVGMEDADIEITHLKRAHDDVGLELLLYHSYSPRSGMQHLAYEVEDILGTITSCALRGYTAKGRVVTIPDGPQTGTKCVYMQGPDYDIIELVERPKRETV